MHHAPVHVRRAERPAGVLSVLARQSFAELPPRVEYCFTPFGARFLEILDAVERLQGEVAGGSSNT